MEGDNDSVTSWLPFFLSFPSLSLPSGSCVGAFVSKSVFFPLFFDFGSADGASVSRLSFLLSFFVFLSLLPPVFPFDGSAVGVVVSRLSLSFLVVLSLSPVPDFNFDGSNVGV